MSETDQERRLAFTINRVLIVLTIAAILAGLYTDQWRMTLRNARLICYACIGLE